MKLKAEGGEANCVGKSSLPLLYIYGQVNINVLSIFIIISRLFFFYFFLPEYYIDPSTYLGIHPPDPCLRANG